MTARGEAANVAVFRTARMLDPATATIAQVRELEADMEDVRARYGRGETGYVGALGHGLVLVWNIPIEPRLHYYDICRATGFDKRGFLELGDVVRRLYQRKSRLQYAGTVPYVRLRDAFWAAGLCVEGHGEGVATVMHQDDEDAAAALRAGGVDDADWHLGAHDPQQSLREVFYFAGAGKPPA